MNHLILVLLTLQTISFHYCQYCPADKSNPGTSNEDCPGNLMKRYLLYDVNPGEGFNLRRDVYLRTAIMAKALNKYENWILVLPPWPHLYHWKSKINQSKLPWHRFFNIPSLNSYTKVMEFETYLKEQGTHVETVLYLQSYDNPWEGGWEEKYNITDCKKNIPYHKDKEFFKGHFFGFKDVYASKVFCVNFQGSGETLIPLIRKINASSVFIDRAENLLHSHYGGHEYWSARKSMKFSEKLLKIAEDYIKSTWEEYPDSTKELSSYEGGLPYIAVHLRRQDFLHSRREHTPTLEYAANEIINILSKLNLKTVFLSTDGTVEEVRQLGSLLTGYRLARFTSNHSIIREVGDGGVAIIDQIICSLARLFVGSYESTFSFRIQEEREILGFDPDTTFNRFCGENEVKCEQPARWRIVHGDDLNV